MRDALKEAEIALEREMDLQIDLIYNALALALGRYWGWGSLRIRRLMDETHKTWEECASTNEHSMIEMLELETGMELKCETGDSWHDLAFLNAKIPKRASNMSRAQWIYMRQRQKTWVRPQLLACVFLSLHRRYGFGAIRCIRILEQIDNIEREFNFDKAALKAACIEETRVEVR